jgi:hypothetical protein
LFVHTIAISSSGPLEYVFTTVHDPSPKELNKVTPPDHVPINEILAAPGELSPTLPAGYSIEKSPGAFKIDLSRILAIN